MPTEDLFHARLDQMIDLRHPLAVLQINCRGPRSRQHFRQLLSVRTVKVK